MKVFCHFSLLVVLLITVCSCKDDNENPTPEQPTYSITVEENDTHSILPQEGGTVTIPFTATGDWTASLMNDRAEGWITIAPSSGKAGDVLLSITAAANDTYDERNATIVLKCGTVTKNIVLTQKQKDAILVSASKYEIPSEGGEINIEVQANVTFEVEVKSEWIKQIETRALATSSLNFTIEVNETGEPREGEIIIKNGELSETIQVFQSFDDFIILTQKDYTLPEEGGSIDVEIRSTVDYGVKVLDNAGWITEMQTRAVSTHTHHYQVAPNDTYDPREAKIVFYSLEDESLADTVTVYQVQLGAIVVARNEYTVDERGGILTFEIQTNVDFEVIIDSPWMIKQIPSTRGLDEYELSFMIADNSEGDDQEGTITIKDKNSDLQQVITIKQVWRSIDREVLIALYKATNGDGWTNNENWCTDKPLREWYGIGTDGKSRVVSIILDRNNLIGTLPENIGKMDKLRTLKLNDNYLYGELPESFYDLTALGYFSVGNYNFGSEGGSIVIDPNNPGGVITLGRNQLSGTISEKIGNLKNLSTFDVNENEFTGELPKNIWTLPKLETLLLTHNKDLHGELPEDIGNLKDLKQLWLAGNKFSGELPEAITSLTNLEELVLKDNAFTGELPKDIGKLKKLRQLVLDYNLFTGDIPESLWELTNMEDLSMVGGRDGKLDASITWADGSYKITNYNSFTGRFPANIGNMKKLTYFSVDANELTGEIPDSFYELQNIKDFNVSRNNISGILSEKLGNLKTLVHFLIDDCNLEGTIPESVRELKELRGFSLSSNNLTGNVPVGFAELPKLEYLYLEGNRLSGALPQEIVEMDLWKTKDIKQRILNQQNGYILYIGSNTSTDFSKDGEVITLQKHSAGKGIKLVLMGDAFIDTDMESGGHYETMMRKAMEGYFSVEPFKSLREYYDVVCIKAVSKNNQIGQETTFETRYGEDTYIEGNNEKAMLYAAKAFGTDNIIDDIQVIIVLNDSKYAGTCHMYTNGFSVAYCPYVNNEEQAFGEMIHHEAGGHGFAFLADEYSNGGTIPALEIQAQQESYDLYGWNANVDFTSDISQIKWNHIATDSRYAQENIGAYDGGLTYTYGVYRPTENSIMRYNVGQYNAPSREAIYKRAMKLAYGGSWAYNYEDFVQFDAPSRTTTRSVWSMSKPKNFVPLAPPVIHDYPAVVK